MEGTLLACLALQSPFLGLGTLETRTWTLNLPLQPPPCRALRQFLSGRPLASSQSGTQAHGQLCPGSEDTSEARPTCPCGWEGSWTRQWPAGWHFSLAAIWSGSQWRGVYILLATYWEGLLVFKLNTDAGKVFLSFGDTCVYAACARHTCVYVCVFTVLPRKS